MHRNFGEAVTVYDGTHQTPKYVDDGVMFLSVENINTLKSEKFISEMDFLSEFKISPEYGDILMTRIGDIGTPNVVRTHEKLAYYVSLALLKPNNSDSDFIATSIQSPYTQARLWERTLHVAFPKKINKGEIETITLYIPSLPEQTAIGDFFHTLDGIIASVQRKLIMAKKMKQAFLQRMFPQAGETVPKVRFAGFTEPWIQLRLGEITQIKTGDSDVQDAVLDGQYPFYIRSDTIKRSTKYLYDGEAILIPGEGRLGEIYHYINGKFDYHQRVYKISDFNNNIDGKFILYSMQKTFKKHALSYTAKATVDSLRLPMLTEFIIMVPSYKEQIAIGNFFLNLDTQITTQQTKLDNLKRLKSAFLQKMFV